MPVEFAALEHNPKKKKRPLSRAIPPDPGVLKPSIATNAPLQPSAFQHKEKTAQALTLKRFMANPVDYDTRDG